MKSRRKKPSASGEQWDRLVEAASHGLEGGYPNIAGKMSALQPASEQRRVFVPEEVSKTDSEIVHILASLASSVSSASSSINGPSPAHVNGTIRWNAAGQQQHPYQYTARQLYPSNRAYFIQSGPMKQEERPGSGSMANRNTGAAPSSMLSSKLNLTLQNGVSISPPAPSRCCHPDVPDVLLHILDHPSAPLLEHLRQYSPFQSKMCHVHASKLTQKTLNFLLEQEAARAAPGLEPVLATGLAATARRTCHASLALPPMVPDDEPPPKRQYVDDCDGPYYDCVVTGTSKRHGPVLDTARDDAFRREVMRELEEKLKDTKAKSHGHVTATLIHNLLQVCQSPDPSEALLLSGPEAAAVVEAGPVNCPIFTEGQQQFRWKSGSRPIEEMFRRMENLNRTVSVQVPSRKAHLQSFKKHKLSEVQQRFLENGNGETDDPWNILDLRNPLPPTVMPKFLAGENCQLLSRVRDAVLSGSSAERTVAAKEKWNEWLDVLDWVLMSEGGHNTAPHMDSHGLATWITVQEGQFGFGWLSDPTKEERDAWIANPQTWTGGRWRFTVLTPGKTVFFNSGTIHFVFRLRRGQTMALGGHILQWSGIEHWVKIIREQLRNPQITNEDVEWSAPKYLRVVSDLVISRVKNGRVDELGGQQAVDRFLDMIKVCSSRPHILPASS
jgi:hypothetical protein